MSWPLVHIGEHVERVETWNPISSGIDDLFKYIDLSSVDKDSKTITESAVNLIHPNSAPSRARQIVKENDVLISTVRPNLNGVALVNQELDGATASTGYCVLRANKKSLDSNYLFYWVQSSDFIDDMIKNATGANYPAVSDRIVKNNLIPLPPLGEQKRIATILDKAGAIRRKRQQAIKLADDFLRSVFLEMFGDLSIGEMTRFGEVVSLDAKMVDPREKDFIDLVHIGPDRIEKETGKLLPALTAREENLISKKFLFDESYVLYSKIRPYLKKCALARGIGLCSADMYPIRPIEGRATKEFIWMLLLSDLFSSYTSTLPDRASIPKLNRTELADFEFSLPDHDSQMRFSKIVSTVVAMKEKVEKQGKEIDVFFSGLSQKAFSGEL